MSKEEYVRYQDYFKTFLGGWSFEDGDKTLTIKDVKEEEMYDAQTQGKKKGLCVWFKEEKLPMVLNVTNAETIAMVCGSDRMSDWKGKRITVGQSSVKAFGKVQKVIRVRPEAPKEAVTDYITPEQIDAINGLIETGAITNANMMLKYYKVSRLEEMSRAEAEQLIRQKSAGI